MKSLLNIINNNGVAIIPTETVYGLVCSGDSDAALERIFNIKNRGNNSVVAVLCGNVEWFLEYAICSGNIKEIIRQCSPSATTWVLDFPNDCVFVVNLALKAKHVNRNGTVSVGVRVPNSRFCLDVLHDFGKPIAATSVNISGEKPAVLFTDIAENIVQNVDYVTEGNAKYSGSGVPSTIVKISDGNVSFLRKGENYILISEKLSVI